jgi:ribosome maturation factor RimP
MSIQKLNNIPSMVESLLIDFLTTNQYKLDHIEYLKEGNNWFLRVYIDKSGGVDIEDCSRVSEFLSAELDQHDPIPNAYFLEVSSPGAERPLRKLDDFYQAINQYVYISSYEPIDGIKEFEGTILSIDGEIIEIICEKKKIQIPFVKIASARLSILL